MVPTFSSSEWCLPSVVVNGAYLKVLHCDREGGREKHYLSLRGKVGDYSIQTVLEVH